MVKLSAVLKPNDTCVAAMSLSIDRGTHTTLSPLRWSLCDDAQAAAADHRDQPVDVLCLQLLHQSPGHVDLFDHLVFVDSADVERVDAGRLAKETRAVRVQVLDQIGLRVTRPPSG